MKSSIFKGLIVISAGLFLSGCMFIFQSGRQSDMEKIEKLSQELNELSDAKKTLEEKLSQEIADKQVKLQMKERGLVITVLGDVLFDPGKDKVRTEAYPILDKLASVLKENVPGLNVGIEGHTDNQPIKFSSWKSNWELSTARSLSVLHYLVDKKEISPDRLSAIGYGEYRPVSDNDIREGQQLNRRVEIIILPQLTKVKPSEGADVEELSDEEKETIAPEENLK